MWVSDAWVCRFVMPLRVYGTWPCGSISQCWWPLSRHFWIALLHLLDSGIFLSQITLGNYIWSMTRCTNMVIPILYDVWSACRLWSCCNVFTATWVLSYDLVAIFLLQLECSLGICSLFTFVVDFHQLTYLTPLWQKVFGWSLILLPP